MLHRPTHQSVPLSSDQTLKLEKQHYYRRGMLVVSSILFVLLLVTVLWEANNGDLIVSQHFYQADQGWFLAEKQPWQWIYRYGTIPGFLFTFVGLLAWYLSYSNLSWATYRNYFLLYSLTSIIGAGILVNAVLKEYTGRPRPREVSQLGGQWEYRAVFDFGTPGKGRSFPCGHCTMGFVFTTGIMFWQRSRKWALISLSVGLVYGTVVSATRIVQGGHFVSDAWWALGIIVLVVTILYYFFLQPPLQDQLPFRPLSRQKKLYLAVGILVFLGGMTILFLTRRPFYKDYQHRFLQLPTTKQLKFK